MNKVLVLGGTGALGVYFVEELISKGYEVDIVSVDCTGSESPHVKYIRENAKNNDFLIRVLKASYDAVIDFMLYETEEFKLRYLTLLKSTKHYIFLSSYRIYADSKKPITESSDRLLEIADESLLCDPDDYSLYKARQEDMLRSSGFKNWTILRPSITFSKRRFQLTVLEANILMYRIRKGKTVVLPKEAMGIQSTMTWAKDSAKMVIPLLCDESAFGETYTVATGEHHTWREIAGIYKEICGLKYIEADTEDFLNIIAPDNPHIRRQLLYDRFFNRAINNAKILRASGLTQSDLTLLKDGLKHEIDALPPNTDFGGDTCDANLRMDEYLRSVGIED